MAGVLDDVFPWLLNQEVQNGNPFAVSPMGAHGPAQLMSGTETNPGYGVQPAHYAGKTYNPNIPGDIAENKRVGHDVLGGYFQHYGDMPTALAAYNWGPGNVDKWISLGKPENLMPSETKNYVKKIMAHVQGNAQPGTMPGDVVPGSGGSSSYPMNVQAMAPQQAPTPIPVKTTTIPGIPVDTAYNATPQPTSAPMPDNSTPPPTPPAPDQGFDLKTLLSSKGGWGSLGPSLLALGAGIAAGGAPGGGGWGAGLGKGFAGANEIQQRGLENKLQLATLMNALSNQQFEHGIQTENLGLAKAANSEHQGETNNSINLITSAAQPYQAAKAGLSSWDPVKFAAATAPMLQAVLGYAKLTGQDPKPLIDAMVPKFGMHQADIDAKAQAFESTMQSLGGEGGIASTNPMLAKSAEGLKAFGSPAGTNPAAPPAQAGTGAPVEAGVTSSAPVKVNSAAEARKLKPGTPFVTPDGRHFTR